MRALLRRAMCEYDTALNTHLVAQLCENGVGWFIQLETQLWPGSRGSEWGGPWDNTGSTEGVQGRSCDGELCCGFVWSRGLVGNG